MHIAAPEVGMLGANGIVGAGIPIATGAAFASRYKEDGKVVVSFFGDAASSQGTFHEAINIGASFNLPVVYVCENNLYGVSTYQGKVRKVADIADRAKAYGIEGVIVDGNDVEAVKKAGEEAIAKAREGGGPTLIECKTYRHYTHFVGEPDNYRPKEEVLEWMEKGSSVLWRRIWRYHWPVRRVWRKTHCKYANCGGRIYGSCCRSSGNRLKAHCGTAIRGLGNDCIRSTGESSRKYEIYVRRRAFGSYGYEAPLRRIRGSRGAAFPYV